MLVLLALLLTTRRSLGTTPATDRLLRRPPEPSASRRTIKTPSAAKHQAPPECLTRARRQLQKAARGAAGQVSLEEARFFKANGFLVRENLLDPQLVEQARRRVYAAAPGPVDRADPASWVDAPRRWPPVADTTPRSPPGTDYRDYKGAKGVRLPSSYSTAGNVWKWHAEGDADWTKRLLPENPSVRQVAEQLLAGPVKPSVRARGVYTIFPAADPDATEAGAGGAPGSTPPSSRPFTPARLGGHTDTMAHPLCFMAYLEPAAPRCGGFTLWPGNLKGLLLSRFIGLSALHLPYMCRRNDTPLD